METIVQNNFVDLKNRVIVFGGDNYNTLGVIRSLGENNIDFVTSLGRYRLFIAGIYFC